MLSLYHYSGNRWERMSIVYPMVPQEYPSFGSSVAVDRDGTLMVGSPNANQEVPRNKNSAGSVVMYYNLSAGLPPKMEQIAQLRQLLLGNPEKMALKPLHIDPFGLTTHGALLGFAYSNHTPLLFDSATGKLALYFRGETGQFFSAYYDTYTGRAPGIKNLHAQHAGPPT